MRDLIIPTSQLQNLYRGVEQLVARQAHNLKVAGSSPAPATNFSVVYYVYVIKCDAGRHYIGLTENIDKRLAQHNNGISKWTSRYKNWRLIYQEEFATLSEARKRENFIKRQKGGKGFFKIIEKS